jgi:hypothetical protein
MNMDELTDKEQKYVELSYDELPWKLRWGIGNFDECDDCGEDMVSYRLNYNIKKGKMCFDCGAIQTPDLPSPSSETEDTEQSKSREQAKKDAKSNTGKMLQMIGLLFCLTIVGAIIGIPLLIVGMHLENPED